MDEWGGRLNGLDLFSGIGGITLALEPWVRTIAYCENDRYAQSVLLSRMSDRALPCAGIWDDVTTLSASNIGTPIDIIYGGFPCQDISVAGNGKGLEGKRSSLFFEIIRLAEEARPAFVFLENVPAIRTRGLREVIGAFTALRYDCRWTCVSAAEVGAPHLRRRWFLLAHAHGERVRDEQQWQSGGLAYGVCNEGQDESQYNGKEEYVAYSDSTGDRTHSRAVSGLHSQASEWSSQTVSSQYSGQDVADTQYYGSFASEVGECLEAPIPDGQERQDECEQFAGSYSSRMSAAEFIQGTEPLLQGSDWWAVEPDVGRMVNGLPNRVDRIKCLGNAVVPFQVREAFKRLIGI